MEIPSYHRANLGGRELWLSPALGTYAARRAGHAQVVLVGSLLISAVVHALLAPAHLYPTEAHAHGNVVAAQGPETLGLLFLAAAVGALGLAGWLFLRLSRLALVAASGLFVSLLAAYPLAHFWPGDMGSVSGLDVVAKLTEAAGLIVALWLLRSQPSEARVLEAQ